MTANVPAIGMRKWGEQIKFGRWGVTKWQKMEMFGSRLEMHVEERNMTDCNRLLTIMVVVVVVLMMVVVMVVVCGGGVMLVVVVE